MNSQNNLDETKLNDQSQGEKRTEKFAPRNKGAKKRKLKKILLWVFGSIVAFFLIIAIVAASFYYSGKFSLLNTDGMKVDPSGAVSNVEIEQDGKTVIYGGKKYVYNENITTILCVGVDQEKFSDIDGVKGQNGQADGVFLYAIDTETGESTIIPISRDTMVDVDLYSAAGTYVSSKKQQLCLAYAYGDGKHTSCENTVKSVQRLFYGLPINSYVAIDLKAVEVLSKKVGGVPVTPTETIKYGQYTFYKGQRVVLTGEKARVFVQARDGSKLDSNLNRMQHQKLFIDAFFDKALAKTKEDITFPVSVYNSASKYMVTDITVPEISFLATTVLKSGGSLKYKSIDGDIKKGEKHAEFYANDESVYKTVIDVFYKPAD